MNFKKLFRAPKCYLTVPLIVPLALLICVPIGYYNDQYDFEYYPPIPSSVIIYTPQNIIFGISVAVACVFMAIGLYKMFRYLNSNHRVGLQSTLAKVLVYVFTICGAAAIICLAITSFFSLGDGLWVHLGFHLAFFTTFMIQLGVSDYLLNRLKHKTPTSAYILDGVICAFYIFYFAVGYALFFRPPTSFFSLISISGYVLFALVFIKNFINGTQILEHALIPAGKRN
ncbi:hypothetical protein GPJ56_004649 [Histomonas meleagridis]|uniref:uncharacterized protein n=1 Tax=Histomonas meleagridis TaxID=135588 RepID=UPI00355A4E56|nr:hypothetical protein GPJ56_004649 [Histomonas meleagridis]KAH0797411.1 hypothetical protein GO595_009732 [Histomonas meleagridis]